MIHKLTEDEVKRLKSMSVITDYLITLIDQDKQNYVGSVVAKRLDIKVPEKGEYLTIDLEKGTAKEV